MLIKRIHAILETIDNTPVEENNKKENRLIIRKNHAFILNNVHQYKIYSHMLSMSQRF